MAEEMLNTNEMDTDDIQKYIDTINTMKQTSVSRTEYDRVRDENKKLLESIVAGKTVETASTEAPKPDVAELRKKLFNQDLNNLDYWKNVIELRDTLMENGEKDPFLPCGQKIAPTEEDIQKANKVATIVKDCIEYANGDSMLFTNELQRRTFDAAPARRR